MKAAYDNSASPAGCHWTYFFLLAALAVCFPHRAVGESAGRQVLTNCVPAEVKNLNLQPVGRPSSSQHLKLGIALPLRNEAGLQKLLREIYDPSSPQYHHYLSVEESRDQFGATMADHQALIDFLKSRGLTVTTTYSNRLYVSVDGTVDHIEKAFHVVMKLYQHPTQGRTFFAPDVEPSLDLDVPVLGINGLENLHLPHYPRYPTVEDAQGTGSGGSFQGYDFRNAYVPGLTNTGTGQTIGLWASSTAFSYPSIYVMKQIAAFRPTSSSGPFRSTISIPTILTARTRTTASNAWTLRCAFPWRPEPLSGIMRVATSVRF
jgi:subtilase family serine protease